MPTLSQSLLAHDLGHLRILAEHWGVDMEAPDTKTGLPLLVQQILDRELVTEIVAALPEIATAGVAALQAGDGRLSWSRFKRRFGEIREIGPGRRDRERPDREPISAAEVLWYHGLIARAFFDTARGTEEFAYVPTDLLPLIPPLTPPPVAEKMPDGPTHILGRAATAAERGHPVLATDQILDHACTLLAALRMDIEPPQFDPYPLEFVHALLDLAGLLDPVGVPDPNNARTFLEAARGESLLELVQTWLTSTDCNDLHQIPDLEAEGEWTNNPLQTRRFILRLIRSLPSGTFWNLSAFVADIRQRYPDFQRPAGDYDSWFIKDAATG